MITALNRENVYIGFVCRNSTGYERYWRQTRLIMPRR